MGVVRQYGLPVRRQLSVALILCAVLLLSACSERHTYALVGAITAPPFRTPPPEMQKLCDEHEGLKIYRTAKDVAGFVDTTAEGCKGFCDYALGDSKRPGRYRFVEASASQEFFDRNRPNSDFQLKGLLSYKVDKPGLYRFTKEKIGHPNCRIFERWHSLANRSGRVKRFEIWEDTCIATWPIEKFTARYEIRNDKIGRDRSYGRLVTLIKFVIDRHDNSLVAEHRSNFINFAKTNGGLDCKNPAEIFLPEQVLLPTKNQ